MEFPPRKPGESCAKTSLSMSAIFSENTNEFEVELTAPTIKYPTLLIVWQIFL